MRRVLAEIAIASTLCCGSNAMAAGAGVAPEASAAASGADAAASAAAAPADARMPERDALQALHERLEQLRRDQQATQHDLAMLQARLREAESMRVDPALYGLASLVVLLLVVIATLLWRLARQRSEQAWLHDAQALTALGPRPSEAHRVSPAAVSPSFDEVTMTSMRVIDPAAAAEAPSEPPTAAPTPATTTIPSAARLRRELTPEELIDLEQQADFFIAIGQEESAIDLLMAHVRSSGGTSPLPYLKLLAIYRRRGEATAYQRIRERFNRRFNAHAPEWESDPALGRPLEDYPDVLERVQRAWPASTRASDLLEALLFRRDPVQAGFDLPAYEELLFLYALAKDLVAHEANPDGVDLLLPLETAHAAPIAQVASPSPPPPARTVDVDVDLGAPGPSPTAPPAG